MVSFISFRLPYISFMASLHKQVLPSSTQNIIFIPLAVKLYYYLLSFKFLTKRHVLVSFFPLQFMRCSVWTIFLIPCFSRLKLVLSWAFYFLKISSQNCELLSQFKTPVVLHFLETHHQEYRLSPNASFSHVFDRDIGKPHEVLENKIKQELVLLLSLETSNQTQAHIY